MIRRVDFSRTGDPMKVIDTTMEYFNSTPMEAEMQDLAADVLATIKLADPMRPSGMDAVKLGWMLSERAKGNHPKNVSHDII